MIHRVDFVDNRAEWRLRKRMFENEIGAKPAVKPRNYMEGSNSIKIDLKNSILLLLQNFRHIDD